MRCGGNWSAFASAVRRRRCAVPVARRAPWPSPPMRGWCTRSLGCRLPSLLLLLPRPRWRWRVARGAVRLLARLTGTAITAHGLDHLPAGTCIAVANHPSWIDPLALASMMPQSFSFVAAEVLEHQGINGFVLRRLGHQFVERHEREHGVADTDRLTGLVRSRAVARHLPRRPTGACPRLAALPHGRIRGGRPNRCARRPDGNPRDADNTAAGAPFPATREPSTSRSVSRSGLRAPTGPRQSNCSAPLETPS